jgi:hypothetical protein
MRHIRKTEVFANWLDDLNDIRARARILVRIQRLEEGRSSFSWLEEPRAHNPGIFSGPNGSLGNLRNRYEKNTYNSF